jgi:hypothetical protein
MRLTGWRRLSSLAASLAVAAGLSALWALALAGSAAAALPSNCSESGTAVTCTYTGAGTYTFTVPGGVSSLDVTAVGAAGGRDLAGGGFGGVGASVRDTAVPVSANQALEVVVGGVGADNRPNGAGGSPGGGGSAGGAGGGGGGGYSGLFGPASTALVIAAGGGGGGGGNSTDLNFGGYGDIGAGGGAGGNKDCSSCGGGGGGASQTTGGSGGAHSAVGGGDGNPGMSLAGGLGGASHPPLGFVGGGGGGGGYFGGGGGGGGHPAGGGGGGSSFGVGPGLSDEMHATGAASVTISYTAPPPTLTVSKNGSGSGTVTSSPAGIDCGATCSASFTAGSTVTLAAARDPGSLFAGWSGAGCSGTGTCTVTMSADQSVTATFRSASALAATLVSDSIGKGPGKALEDKARAIQAAVNAGRTATVCAHITDYLGFVQTQTGQHLTQAEATLLTTDATNLATALGC